MTKLFVGGIPQDLDEEELKDIFTEFGSVIAVNIVRDKRTRISRRFGFVEMDTEEEARKAISLFHGGNIDDQEISVKPIDPDPKKKSITVGKRKIGIIKKPKAYVVKKGAPHPGKRPRIKRGNSY